MQGRTYRYFDGEPVYPFGYGLSYTHFAYSGVKITPHGGDAANGIVVETEVTNIGSRSGDEVAQLYVHFPADAGHAKDRAARIPEGQPRRWRNEENPL